MLSRLSSSPLDDRMTSVSEVSSLGLITNSKKGERTKMSTVPSPVLDMNKLNAFIGQFVTDLGASVHAGMVVIGEKLGLYKALATRPMGSAELAAETRTDERYLRE